MTLAEFATWCALVGLLFGSLDSVVVRAGEHASLRSVVWSSLHLGCAVTIGFAIVRAWP